MPQDDLKTAHFLAILQAFRRMLDRPMLPYMIA